MRFPLLSALTAALLATATVARTYAATPVSGEFYWTSFGSDNAYGHGSFTWTGLRLSASTTFLASLPSLTVDGSLKVGSDGNIYSGRAGSVTQINPVTGVRRSVSSGVNNNVTSIDPSGSTVIVGWKDTPLATLATGSSFGPGTPRVLRGDDTVATGVAWDANGTVWYTTGGEDRLGNVGRLSLFTFTSRVLSSVSATSIVFDPFTGHLFTAGINGIAQIDPGTGTVVSTWANPLGTGLRIQNLSVTGKGHLVAFDSSGLLRLWDFTSGSRLIGQQDTIAASTGTQVINAGLELAEVPGEPTIVSPLQVTTTVGQPFVYVIQTAAPATSSGARGLPPGLTSDIVPLAITGTPTATGTFQVSLSAANPFGTATATLVINVQPASRLAIVSSRSATGRRGQPFKFQVITSGGGAATRLSTSTLPAGLRVDPVTGVISGTPTSDGSFAVTLNAVDGNAATSSTLQLTFSSDATLPVIVSGTEASLAPGQTYSYTVAAPVDATASDRPVYQLLGNLPPGLGWDPNAGTISGTYSPVKLAANAANTVEGGESAPDETGPPGHGTPLSGGVITNVQLFATTSRGTTTIPFIFYLKPVGVVNISTRLAVQSGENVLIGGFIVTGNAPKKLILRAIGPSLGITGNLEDPVMQLFEGNVLLGSNDDWRSNQEQEIIDTTIPPADERESAVVATLNPGAYTAVVRGKSGQTGIGLVEVYDLGTASLDSSSAAQLANISTRGFVQQGNDVMIGGFIVSGANTRLIVRAIGPSLASQGVGGALQDTTLELRDGAGTLIAANDDWRTDQEQDVINTTVAPANDRESAIVRTLAPGAYTAVVRGKDARTGVGLVEAYVLP